MLSLPTDRFFMLIKKMLKLLKSVNDGDQDSGNNCPFNPLIHSHKTHFENLATFAAIFLKYVWQFRDIIHETVKDFPLIRLIHS